MSDQLSTFLCSLLKSLVQVRTNPFDSDKEFHYWARFGAVQGKIGMACDLDLITLDQFFLLGDLLHNASSCSGLPFPDRRNLGPQIPIAVLFERCDAAVKQSAQVLADEPAKVSVPSAPRDVRLLCVLVPSTDGHPRTLPIHTMRPMPPRTSSKGRWSLAGDAGLYLRETHAVAPSPEVLARCARHGQTDAIRADSRAVQSGGLTL